MDYVRISLGNYVLSSCYLCDMSPSSQIKSIISSNHSQSEIVPLNDVNCRTGVGICILNSLDQAQCLHSLERIGKT